MKVAARPARKSGALMSTKPARLLSRSRAALFSCGSEKGLEFPEVPATAEHHREHHHHDVRPCRPSPWHGRYARIPGHCTAFHLVQVRGRLGQSCCGTSTGGDLPRSRVRCRRRAGRRRGPAKGYAGGSGHGSFHIDEFGQALVPASDGSGRRTWPGIKGRLLFEIRFCPEELIDLAITRRLQPGDPWKLPYVGIPHNLHREGRIYFYKKDEYGGRVMYPPQQDEGLIRVIRSLRPRKAVRFIVTARRLGGH